MVKPKVIVWLSGGLGNQMFQYAYCEYLKQRGIDNVYCDKEMFRYFDTGKGHELYKLHYFGIKPKFIKYDDNYYKQRICLGWAYSKNSLIENKYFGKTYLLKWFKQKANRKLFTLFYSFFGKEHITIQDGHYTEVVFNRNFAFNLTPEQVKNSLSMHGTFQSYKYLEPIKEIIYQNFSFQHIDLQNKKHIKSILNDILATNSVAIHIRRSDFVDINCCLPMKYYIDAISYLRKKHKNLRFFIFSDDIQYIKDNFDFLTNKYIVDFFDKKADFYSLFLMSQAKHNIIANSSFSWWGAWLNRNPNKIVCIPGKNKMLPISPPDWVKIYT